ncbi:translation elongation factor G [Nitzschia inconspicua]|uniref:Translation elongation factor G n=1 Tax=Nitzschia inconspicua TaxID=303405 RepID=A0A9K3KZB1_9STRA|nr:translation elongation factor G [Nitzschia inconspicua]
MMYRRIRQPLSRLMLFRNSSSIILRQSNHPSKTARTVSRFQSSALPKEDDDHLEEYLREEHRRLKHLRNVGVLAHVDAGKTTVTERMLALAGVVRSCGSVDEGSTVTDYLPAEKERGITIQSAAISFEWGWHNNKRGDDMKQNDKVNIQIIDTPGHVDFSVEVNRSVAVLDGAVLVLDAVAGVQAQTETVWRAITKPSLNNHVHFSEPEFLDVSSPTLQKSNHHGHEPLPCLALINKMDKDGCNFGRAVQSIRDKLPGANPIPTQMPLFRGNRSSQPLDLATIGANDALPSCIEAVSAEALGSSNGEFVGVVDLIHMRAILWPEMTRGNADNVENCVPRIVNLLQPDTRQPIHKDCAVTQEALKARYEFVEALAEVDAATEEYYLQEQEPSNAELRAALRRATLAQKAVPVMAGAALKGKGVELVLDGIADLLPSPLDRLPPSVNMLQNDGRHADASGQDGLVPKRVRLGHPLHPSLLALAFKVVHMKGRGGGDGRVVFARVYSGKLQDRDQLQVITPPAPGEIAGKPRTERVSGMLELAGGRFNNIDGGEVKSGSVCALVGLKSVMTGDTLMLASETSMNSKPKRGKAGSNAGQDLVYLAGVAAPKPVLTVRLEAETSEQQSRLSEVLKLMSTEDPSLVVEETDSTTLLSGLGELHIDVTVDRLFREHGLRVTVGPPSVSFCETVMTQIETPGGLVNYDRTIGGTRLQAAVHLIITPNHPADYCEINNACTLLSSPVVTVGPDAREFLGLNQDLTEEELLIKSDIARALILGCQGALKRGTLRSAEMTNVVCHVENVDAEGGLASLKALPGALQAASAHSVATCLKENKAYCSVLEPTMSVEISLPNDMVGAVLSDLNNRRGTVGDVIMGEGVHGKSLVRGDVPLVEILGYANRLRSLTGGEASFTSEYKGHSPCS